MSISINRFEIEKALQVIQWGSKSFEEYQKSFEILKEFAQKLPEEIFYRSNAISLKELVLKLRQELDFCKIFYMNDKDVLVIWDNRSFFKIMISLKTRRFVSFTLLKEYWMPHWLLKVIGSNPVVQFDLHIGQLTDQRGEST